MWLRGWSSGWSWRQVWRSGRDDHRTRRPGLAMKRIGALIRLMRAREWVKNLLVFAPLLFSGNLGALSKVWLSGIVFLIFCAASSFGYVCNDLADREKD